MCEQLIKQSSWRILSSVDLDVATSCAHVGGNGLTCRAAAAPPNAQHS